MQHRVAQEEASRGQGAPLRKAPLTPPSHPHTFPTCSIASLKKKLAEAKARKAAAEGGGAEGEGAEPAVKRVPIEAERILTQEDFERIRCGCRAGSMSVSP